MGLLADIAALWRSPGLAIRAMAAREPGEDRLLAYLMGACLISFLVGLPGLIAATPEIEEGTQATGVAATFVGALIFAPLFLYGLAAISHLAARSFGGQAAWREARLALFFSVLAVQPAAILVKLAGLVIPPDGAATVLSGLLALAFLRLWLVGLIAMERGQPVEIAEKTSGI